MAESVQTEDVTAMEQSEPSTEEGPEKWPADEATLKRLLFLANVEQMKYFCGGRKYAPQLNVDVCIDEYLKNRPKSFLRIIENMGEDDLLPIRSHLFFILGKALHSDNATPELKPMICATALKIAKSDNDFFAFIRHSSHHSKNKKTKLPNSVCTAIVKFYKNKTPEQLTKSYIECRRYHGWRHNDLMRLAHIKCELPVQSMIVDYIFKRRRSNQTENEEAKSLIEMLEKSTKLRCAKDIVEAIPLIRDLKVNSLEQVASPLRRKSEIWLELLPNLPIPVILRSLPRLFRWGFLKKDTPTLAKVLEVIGDPEKVKASGLHPIQVFIYLRTFERGGRPLDPKLKSYLCKYKGASGDDEVKIKKPTQIKCHMVVNEIYKCMALACHNLQPSGKRYLITVDTTDKMDTPCLRYKNITSTEVAAAFAWYLLRVEEDVTVAVFKENTIGLIELDKEGKLPEYAEKFRSNRSKYLTYTGPVEWATAQKKQVDVFLNFIQHHKSHNKTPKEEKDKDLDSLNETMTKYRNEFNLPDAKMVNLCGYSCHLATTDKIYSTILDVSGLDVGVPKVVEAFCRNHFC